MEINFMSWNTRLYMQGNYIRRKQEDINDQKVEQVLNVIKNHITNGNSIAILQEIPYKINKEYKKGNYDIKKWEEHPIFKSLMDCFPDEKYDVLYDNSNQWRIIQTVVIASKGLIESTEKGNSNSFYNFKIGALECLAVHSDNAFELRNWINSHNLSPKLIAGDFNAGNYVLKDKSIDNSIAINRQNYLLLTEGYRDLFQGRYTTNYGQICEPRQIDHVLVENSYEFKQKYKFSGINVDESICVSDHFPLYWTLEEIVVPNDNHP